MTAQAGVLPQVNILLVDDRPENLLWVEAVLRPLGHNLIRAISGDEALKVLLRHEFALILLDVQMPGLDGIETANYMKQLDKTRDIPIIFLTANSTDSKHVSQGYSVGAVDYLFKPLDPEMLRSKVSVFVELYQGKRQLVVERKRVEETNADLQAVNEAMRDFVAHTVHDLRSPLTALVGFSTLLAENWATFSEEDRRKFVATIDRKTKHLVGLVDDLLTLSKIDGGALNTRPELIVLGEAIDRCLEASGGDTANVSVSCSPDLVVRVDPSHLGRILDNYLQNGFKYGEPPVRIEATRVGDVVEVRVRDNGPGVPPEFVPRLFAKFARADTSGTMAEKGTGLGLSIVRELAEANGGQACYEPDASNGACFVVCLRTADEPGR